MFVNLIPKPHGRATHRRAPAQFGVAGHIFVDDHQAIRRLDLGGILRERLLRPLAVELDLGVSADRGAADGQQCSCKDGSHGRT